jgi:branched-chain amino acid transport system substrate-binding protein
LIFITIFSTGDFFMKPMISLLAATSVAMLATVSSAQAQEVKLGVVMSNTGTYAFVGTPVINAIRMAFDEMQASNYFGATKVSLMIEDNRSNTQEALALLTRMATRDNAVMVIGPVATGEAMAAAPVANELKIPIFTTATSPAVLKPGPWVFKVTETADQYMTLLGEHIAQKRKPKNCFNITIRDNEGYILQNNVFRDTIKKGGVAIAAEESILSADTDFTALATKIVTSKADCLFLSTPPEQGANIILQARQAGMPASTLLVGNTGMGANFVKAGGSAVDGTVFSAESVPTGVNDLAKSFIVNYTKRYNVTPDSWAMVGYSMALIAANAIKTAGPNPTRDKVREAMLATKNLPVVIGRGTWSIADPATRIPTFGYAVLKIQGGKFVEDK